MSERIRVVLAVDEALPEPVRVELDSSLEAAGWFSASDDYTCWVCKARGYEFDEVERQVRKMLEFAAFNAGIEGRLTFALKLGESTPKVSALRVGSGGLKTKPVAPRALKSEFSTERVSDGGMSHLPAPASLPTQLKTAF
ncbi:MAG: hypothetical protein K8I27_07855 [Planctomycetes bacterium]|nr:hypothetical protein [Planctomycetota bacterium]